MSEYTTVVVRDAKEPIQLGNLLLGGVVAAASTGNLVEEMFRIEASAAPAAPAVKAEPVAWQLRLLGCRVMFEVEFPSWAEGDDMYEIRPLYAAPPAQPDAALVEALEHARQFIRNGIDLGFIRMPDADAPDPAHETLPKIDAALSTYRAALAGKGGE